MLSSSSSRPAISGSSGPSFGCSADGMSVALVGETAYAMAPGRNGRHYLVSGWRIARPMAEWTREDFYGHAGELADQEAFRAQVLDQAEHQRQKRELCRLEIGGSVNTPWGVSQGGTLYAEGITAYSTAGHGGFRLSAGRNRKVHPMLRSAGGCYEEDAEWAIVAITFPHLFTAFESRGAEQTVRYSWPDAWEAIFGTILEPSESREKDRRAFEAKHANDWVVISAITSDHEKGYVECIATPGGKRGAGTEERRFLVPVEEYEIGRFGFVIDPERHRIYAGPSNFVGWQGRCSP
ncbi:DUF7007 domain-containing protein [Mesorhizobium sp. SP-1A]|uniref:DUF7007 domain-containing protein n=1 Tax=Mesorhizobium sp. SP-1A TaxID=3077840 RepID=UPI0028F7485C|nr:hypothetical protein [Mesorhizobium sp. SP-1A]